MKHRTSGRVHHAVAKEQSRWFPPCRGKRTVTSPTATSMVAPGSLEKDNELQVQYHQSSIAMSVLPKSSEQDSVLQSVLDWSRRGSNTTEGTFHWILRYMHRSNSIKREKLKLWNVRML
ncbi:hypothetical protein P8452_55691 [Trifolium repens]|nr:hypothetical protein P8452_55691 [Trifolium repens]